MSSTLQALGMSGRGSRVAALAASWCLAVAAQGQMTLIPATSPQTSMFAGTISSDGTTLAGGSYFPAAAFRWRAGTGKYDLGNESGFGGRASVAYGVSANGNVVVGVSNVAPNDYGHAFRWSGPGTRQDLGVLPSWSQSTATAVSGDGAVVVGYCTPPVDNAGRAAFRWSAQTGMVSIPSFETATAISRNGGTIVGYGGVARAPYAWTAQTGSAPLAFTPGYVRGVALGVSGDGTIIVGSSSMPTMRGEATIWRSGSPTVLGTPEGWISSELVGVSDNGLIAVGNLRGNDSNPFGAVWTESRGVEPIEDFLTSQGIAFPSGTRFFGITGVSADGRTIAGSCYVPGDLVSSAFVVRIPSPAAIVPVVSVLALRPRRRGGRGGQWSFPNCQIAKCSNGQIQR